MIEILDISSHVELPLAPGFTLPSVRYLNHTGAKGIFDGDSRMKCPKCGDEVTRKHSTIWYCSKHYRYSQIRVASRAEGKAAPSHKELDAMVAALDSELHCPACGRKMNWDRERDHKSVLTIQHDHDGGMRLICQSCNSRHGAYPNDSYYDLPVGYKKCPRCDQILPYSAFRPEINTFQNIRPFCKPCDLKYHREWDRKHIRPLTPDRREYQRQYRASHRKERKEYMEQYYKDNREYLLARDKARYAANRAAGRN